MVRLLGSRVGVGGGHADTKLHDQRLGALAGGGRGGTGSWPERASRRGGGGGRAGAWNRKVGDDGIPGGKHSRISAGIVPARKGTGTPRSNLRVA